MRAGFRAHWSSELKSGRFLPPQDFPFMRIRNSLEKAGRHSTASLRNTHPVLCYLDGSSCMLTSLQDKDAWGKKLVNLLHLYRSWIALVSCSPVEDLRVCTHILTVSNNRESTLLILSVS